MTPTVPDHATPPELRGRPRSSGARSPARPWEEESAMQDVLHIPFVTITLDQRPGGWHGSIAWPLHHVERFTDLYGEPTLGSLADAIHAALLMGLGDCQECGV